MKSAVLLALAMLPAHAEIFEWWQSTDAPLFSRERISAVVHTQLRARHQFRDLFHGRIGPVVRMPLSSKWTLSFGYYFSEAEEDRDEWRNNHRTFAGLHRVLSFSSGQLTVRTMAEHHFGGGNPQDRRFRQSFVWSHRAPLSPYAGTETSFDREGFMNQRIRGGVKRAVRGGYALDIGYIYDIRQFRAGEHRHVIHTSIRPRRRER